MQKMKKKLAQLQHAEMESFSSSSASSDSSAEESENESDSHEEVERKVKLLSERDEKVLAERAKNEEKKRNVVPYTNKQRVLMLCSRGITTRYRHFMEDLRALMPHHRKEIKHDTKKRLHEINEICEMKSCNG